MQDVSLTYLEAVGASFKQFLMIATYLLAQINALNYI